MNHIILFDSEIRDQLLPITLTRPVSDLRLGILTIKEKWSHLFGSASFSHITSEDLEPLYPISIQEENLLINSAVVPSHSLKQLIQGLTLNEALMLGGELIAARLPRQQFENLLQGSDLDDIEGYELQRDEIKLVRHLWQIPSLSTSQVAVDMDHFKDTDSKHVDSISIVGDHPVLIHPTAKLDSVIINADDGPVYVGAEAWVMDGSILRGPVAIGDKSVVRMGAKLFGGSVIGPSCVVGGEMKNSTILGYSNKAHAGYLGDSLIGEWCNLGALTSNSNVRNTLSAVKVWNHVDRVRKETGLLKCGVMMADFCRTSIHSKLGAGSVIGVSCHVFGEGFSRPYVPSFTWGGMDSTSSVYELEKAMKVNVQAQAHKGKIMEQPMRELLRRLFATTQADRDQYLDL